MASDAIIQTLSSLKCLMQIGFPARRIPSDCVSSIYNGVYSAAAVTSMAISVAGSHLLLYSRPAQFPFCFWT